MHSSQELGKHDDVAEVSGQDPEAVDAGRVEGKQGGHGAEYDHEDPEGQDVLQGLAGVL